MEMGKPKARTYQYDGNGNPLYYEESKSFRSMVWDEENRLRGINDNGKLHLYTYDHTGERALKSSGESSTVVTNGLTSAVITHMDDYTAYVNPYFVVQKGRFTKHYFEGSSRIVSKLGEGTFHHNNRGISAGGIDYIRQSAQMQEARDRYIKGSLTPPGPPTQHGIYASPEWTEQPYPSLGWQNIRQDQEPPEGWPRPPKFNEPGDVPGPPVQYGDPITPQTVKAGYGFIDNGIIEKNLYFYHPDHLGSSSYITDREGRITQHTEYIAFGEVLFEEHSVSPSMPYLFNGKELDSETNLTYFGARYLDMKTSLWLNTDPLSGYNPIQETEHYIDGQHNNGVFNPMNHNTYGYTYNNPVIYVDPTGKQAYFMGRNGFYMEGDPSWGTYIGNVRPISAYHELTRIRGTLYHKNTTNLFAKIGNAFGGNFVEHKKYDSAHESFYDELQWTVAGHLAFKGLGVVASSLLKNAGGSLWKIAPLERGFVYESMMNLKGAMKSSNFPKIDAFYKGVATSVKTLDLGAKSYLKNNAVFNKLIGYVDDLAGFNGATWGDDVVRGSDITKRVLEVGIPRGASSSQLQQINNAIKYGAEKGVKVNVRVVK